MKILFMSVLVFVVSGCESLAVDKVLLGDDASEYEVQFELGYVK